MLDIRLNTDGDFDLQIADGDLVVGDATGQHQKLLLLIEKGENREFPLTGVGVSRLILDELSAFEINSLVKTEFENDGMTLEQIRVVNNQSFYVNARYD